MYKYCKPQFDSNKKQPKDLHKEEKTGLKQRLAGITCVRIGWVAEKRGRPIWPLQLSSGLSFHSWGGCRYIFTFCRVCNPESSVLCCQGFLDNAASQSVGSSVQTSILSVSLSPHKASRRHCGGQRDGWRHGGRHGGGQGGRQIWFFDTQN